MTEHKKPKLTGRGGPDRGQGRKKGKGNRGEPKRKSKTFRLQPWIIDWLQTQEDMTATIEQALVGYYKLKPPAIIEIEP